MTGLALGLLLAAAPASAQRVSLDAVSMSVSSADRSIAFYRDQLGFSVVKDVTVDGDDVEALENVFPAKVRVVRMALGSEQIELQEFIVPFPVEDRAHLRGDDLAFQSVAIVVSDIAAAYAKLAAAHVRHISPGPQDFSGDPKGHPVLAFFFRDPDGHPLELVQFPEGKGEARWHDKSKLFLGIAHSSIVVRDTNTSLAFYRDVLGLRVKDTGDHQGKEIQRLVGIKDAKIRVTTLSPDAGPDLKLVEYFTPVNGRPVPSLAGPQDTMFEASVFRWNAQFPMDAIRAAGGTTFSQNVVELDDSPAGFGQEVIVRDPDGHPVDLGQPAD